MPFLFFYPAHHRCPVVRTLGWMLVLRMLELRSQARLDPDDARRTL